MPYLFLCMVKLLLCLPVYVRLHVCLRQLLLFSVSVCAGVVLSLSPGALTVRASVLMDIRMMYGRPVRAREREREGGAERNTGHASPPPHAESRASVDTTGKLSGS